MPRPAEASALASFLESAPSRVDSAQSAPRLANDALRAIRNHLGMDVAFISEFTPTERVFRYVDAEAADCPVEVGGAGPLEDSYCQRVVDGRLPELINDAAAHPAAAELPVTAALPVGAHLSVPIRLADGRVFGTFCCFSAAPDHSLNDRDLAMMRVFADLTGAQIDRDREGQRRQEDIRARLRGAMAGNGLAMVFQPIADVDTGEPVGFEALARFEQAPVRGPDQWFAEAAEVGLGADLELAAIRMALRHLRELPPHAYLAVNVSPSTAISGRLDAALGDC